MCALPLNCEKYLLFKKPDSVWQIDVIILGQPLIWQTQFNV